MPITYPTGLLFGPEYRLGHRIPLASPATHRCAKCGKPLINPEVGVLYSPADGRLYEPKAIADLFTITSRALGWVPLGADCVRRIPPEYRTAAPVRS